jgi:hypothetical protein
MRVSCQQCASCRYIWGAWEWGGIWEGFGDGDSNELDLLCREELESAVTPKRDYIPSTAAITTLSSAVSVALVKLEGIVNLRRRKVSPYVLYVNLAFFRPTRLLRQTQEASFEVFLACLQILRSAVKVGEDVLNIRVFNLLGK